MGNKQLHHTSVIPHDYHHYIELDRHESIYSPNDIISGYVLHLKRQRQASLLLTGIIQFEKHKKKRIEKCQIEFYSIKFDLPSTYSTKQKFQFHLNKYLPPSFNHPDINPNLSYTINLVYRKTKAQIYASMPIFIRPIVKIDQPLLLAPFYYGPIRNLNYGTRLEIKLNRAAFTCDDLIHVYYEFQNPNEEFIEKIEVSLGVYYSVQTSSFQQDISNNLENIFNIASKQKLLRNKALLNIPENIYLPPTFTYKYDEGNEQSIFNLTIEYKVQFKIYLANPTNLWQVDVPIVLCNELLRPTEIETTPVTETPKSS